MIGRYCRAYEHSKTERLYDVNRSPHTAVDEVMEMLSLFETRYAHFTVAHCYDCYRNEHKGERSYNWVRTHLQEIGLVKKAKKRGAHRRTRERSPMRGMRRHQDDSTHAWQHWDVMVTMDDATGGSLLRIFC